MTWVMSPEKGTQGPWKVTVGGTAEHLNWVQQFESGFRALTQVIEGKRSGLRAGESHPAAAADAADPLFLTAALDTCKDRQIRDLG